jgi:nudix-type nucleoside diphosphatase (YffH/AdpP family)
VSEESPIRDIAETVLSHEKYLLRRLDFEQRRQDGTWQPLRREVYDHGNAAALLPYDPIRRTVLLVRQIRFVTYLNGYPHPLLEVCAGMLDKDDPETAIIREAQEELGYRITQPRHVFDAFMSPGCFTEKISFFTAVYSEHDRAGNGGGLKAEGEDIEVVEMLLDEAVTLITSGGIVDAKTIMLLQWAKLHGVEDPRR